MKFYISLFFLLFLLLIAFVFGSQNNQIVTLNYLIAKADISMALAVSIFTAIGFLIGLLTTLLLVLLRKKRNKTMK